MVAGVVQHHYGFKFTLGEPNGQISERVKRISGLFISGGLEAPIRTDIRNEIWKKLIGNAVFNPLSVLTTATLKDLASENSVSYAVCEALMREVMEIAKSIGITFAISVKDRIKGAQQVCIG